MIRCGFIFLAATAAGSGWLARDAGADLIRDEFPVAAARSNENFRLFTDDPAANRRENTDRNLESTAATGRPYEWAANDRRYRVPLHLDYIGSTSFVSLRWQRRQASLEPGSMMLAAIIAASRSRSGPRSEKRRRFGSKARIAWMTAST